MAESEPEDDFVRDPNHFMKLYTGCHPMSTFLTEAIPEEIPGKVSSLIDGDYV